MSNVLPMAIPRARAARRRVLHVGCGRRSAHRLHAAFRDGDWREIRLDIDERVQPDIVCSAADMSSSVGDRAVDAVWCSHVIEHLHDHELAHALAEFHRVLAPDGFLLLRCPDLAAVAECLLRDGIEHVAYDSPAGPITPLDMLYGHRASIAAGGVHMTHRTGFTDERLGRVLLDAGFSEARTRRCDMFDLWAIAFASRARVADCLDSLARAGLRFDG